jgi:hypothetical protein
MSRFRQGKVMKLADNWRYEFHPTNFTGKKIIIKPYIVLCPNVLYFIILLCLMPDDFMLQGESTGTQLVKLVIFQIIF